MSCLNVNIAIITLIPFIRLILVKIIGGIDLQDFTQVIPLGILVLNLKFSNVCCFCIKIYLIDIHLRLVRLLYETQS